MFYLAVVLEKGQIVDCGLDPENEAELVVEFNRHRPHGVFDPRPFDADMETVPHFAFELRAELTSEESGDVVRLDRVNRRARQIVIDGLQIGLFAEDDISRVFALIHAPVVSGGEVAIDRTAPPGELVEPGVDSLRFPSVGDPLCPWPARDMKKGVVGHSIIDTRLAQLTRQPVMAVAANLQTAGQPGRNAYVTEAQIFIHKVEVVMQALAVIRNQIRLACLLVVPGLVCRAGLHGGENAHQPRLLTPSRENFFHPVFLPEVPLADELDLDTGFRRHLLRVLANPVPEWLGELRIVEDPNLSLEEKRRHASGKADLWQCAENQHPVPTTQYTGNLSGVTFRYQFNAHSRIINTPVWFRLRRVRGK